MGSIASAQRPVDFNRDIRPLLSNTCYQCHGPDDATREAGLRLDIEQNAFAELESGGRAIVPGKSSESELYQRISSDDPDVRMPPADSGKSLSADEIALIKRWVDEGAAWRGHWSFIKPERPAPPEFKHSAIVRNPIDRFILSRLEQENLAASPEADKVTLIRRVTLDLTGLPPTSAEVDAFLADDSPDAYEQLVNRLLDSPRYGEHMARYWLDAARYGDTHGLHLDNERSIWPYRDWVIDAFNNNMPFDQFTVEQLAGDLLPEPTLAQRIATGFNRCNVTTSEGGSINEEYLVRYAVDRVETTATVWLGLTAGCAVCHEHKFDPLTQKEFYQLFAFFNSTADNAMDGNALIPPPTIAVATPEQAEQKKKLEEQLADVRQRIEGELAKIDYQEPEAATSETPAGPQEYVWIDDAIPTGAQPAATGEPWKFVGAADHPVYSGEKASVRTSQGLGQHFFTAAKPGLTVGEGDKFFAYVYLDVLNPTKEIMLQFNDGSWEHRAYWGEDLIAWGQPDTASRVKMGPLPDLGQWVRLEVDAAKVGLKPGAVINGWAFTQFDGTVYWDKAGIITSTPQGDRQFDSLAAWDAAQRKATDATLPQPVKDAIKVEPEKRNEAQQKSVRDYFLQHVYAETRKIFQPLNGELAAAEKALADFEKQIPQSLVMQDLDTPRDAFVLIRGEYDKPGDQVFPGVPASLNPLPQDAPPNRLGLARWLVDPANPLTARVTVNRFWQQYFGTGIVKTTEDFGSQGEWPSHPELLDWLAVEFIESGWNVKAMQKLIVMSGAYRQASRVTPELYARDPQNRLLARGPRFRMDAEMVRDNALAISGLLVEQVGGRSVKPYQPPGLWKAVGYTSSNTAVFKRDEGDALYRRSLYTFWKRTSPPPTMSAFDAPSRETCTVKRARTNTPLQALALMNDDQFVEAARHLAQRLMSEGGASADERITFAFRVATARRPTEKEAEVLRKMFEDQLAIYGKDPEAAQSLISVGESKPPKSLNPAELAAWTMVANVILNLDETVTKE